MNDEDEHVPVEGEEEDPVLADTWEVRPSEEDELADYLLKVEDIEELLLEMKDVSELAVDLAYSSLLYDSEHIAEEVEELEEILDRMQKRLQRKALEALQQGKVSVDQALGLIRLASAAEVISDAALDIADVVLRDVELHPVLVSMIRDSDVTITRGRVREGSLLSGRTLQDVTLETETGMRAIAIKRGPTWIYGPGGDTGIESGDVIVARGPGEGVERFQDALAGRIGTWD